MPDEVLRFGGAAFQPSAANTGNEQLTILRGENMILRGSDGSFYFECYGGHKNLNESIPVVQLEGTVSYNEGETVVSGTATAFKEFLRFGMKVQAGSQVFVVDDIVSDTVFHSQRPADATEVGQTAYMLPLLFEIDNKRGTLIWGNAIKSDRGNIVAVGYGRLRLNGELLPGDSLDATRRIQLALFDPATSQYTVDRIGFAPFPDDKVTIQVVSGGSKGMSLGYYSWMFAWANSDTAYGFSNPGKVVKLDVNSNPIQLTSNNQRFKIDLTAALASKPVNADAVIIYRSFYESAEQNPNKYAEGSWYVAATVDIADLEPGDIAYIDVLDGELGTEVSFDNDEPPEADWVSFLAGDPILISCHGEKTVTNGDGTSPGPFIVPAKRGNRDAFPADLSVPLSPPDTIIGFVPSIEKLFLLTRVSLPFAFSTGQSDFPVTTHPFWQTGFHSPFGLVFVNDVLYAFTSKGVTRSIAQGDVGSEQFDLAGAVQEITQDWHAGYVHAVRDVANEMIVFIYSAAYKNDDGYWVSVALPYYLRYGIMGPLIVIDKPGRDMIVSGATNVGGHLQFIAGGRIGI